MQSRNINLNLRFYLKIVITFNGLYYYITPLRVRLSQKGFVSKKYSKVGKIHIFGVVMGKEKF